MKKYFITVRTLRSTKLGEWISDEVKKKYDHTVISSDDWEKVKSNVKVIMEDAKENFPRCKQLSLTDYMCQYGETYGRHPRLALVDGGGNEAFTLDTYVIREDRA